ncbi:uncharacterized protein CC84DRAFT_883548 [Paraphaeosphaeria sporulosa]|uniref:Secreted protein n=1 Tax=Paraphaeosphaeria sporulosa TaxID=1460663 RepID=A0A177C9G9_9PLEO|nr:uncharacterized protein CC84DRAFT_883548 [Paraphaeosphaeria sporulosa]OAG04026.1 hypothetical protein CC84DRAFT_883548 [Paraphaeosphaeria sporulosa]
MLGAIALSLILRVLPKAVVSLEMDTVYTGDTLTPTGYGTVQEEHLRHIISVILPACQRNRAANNNYTACASWNKLIECSTEPEKQTKQMW